MFANVLIFIGLFLCGQVLSQNCGEYQVDGTFVCKNEDKQIVTIFSQDFKCREGFICNYNYQVVQNICSPCIAIEHVCGEVFTCVDKTTFRMGENEFMCPVDFVCNEIKKDSCNPCIQEECDPVMWQCVDDTNVILSGIEAICPNGTICNKDNIQPCKPCLNKAA